MLKLPVNEQPYGIELREVGPEGAMKHWRLIGNCSFMNIDWTVRSAEVGLFIGDKACWNKGYGRKSCPASGLGFDTYNLNGFTCASMRPTRAAYALTKKQVSYTRAVPGGSF